MEPVMVETLGFVTRFCACAKDCLDFASPFIVRAQEIAVAIHAFAAARLDTINVLLSITASICGIIAVVVPKTPETAKPKEPAPRRRRERSGGAAPVSFLPFEWQLERFWRTKGPFRRLR